MDKSDGFGRWIVPFKGRNHSGSVQQNFLWRDAKQPIYIMDNHRAAMWCWLQEIHANERFNLLHIDEHFDTLYANIERWMQELPLLEGISIEEYLSLMSRTDFGETPLIRWDTYLSLFLERYGDRLDHCIFATHKNGDRPRVNGALYPDIWDIPNNTPFWIANKSGRWIANIDLDFFFCEMNDTQMPMVSDEYLRTLFLGIREHLNSGKIGVLTICLTPDEGYTGGWESAEQMCEQICSILDVDFALHKP